MFTYQSHPKHAKTEPGDELEFPNEVQIRLSLQPRASFGGTSEPCWTIPKHSSFRIIFNANTGALHAISCPPMKELQLVMDALGGELALHGSEIEWQGRCKSRTEFTTLLANLNYLLPMLINLELPDPPTVLHVNGTVGSIRFRLEHLNIQHGLLRTVDPDSLASEIKTIMSLWDRMEGSPHPRLITGIGYFYTACRLLAAGLSPWEFMGEALLNLAKCLEALFGNSNDEIRAELRKLGFDDSVIEADFITVMILRHHFDVAHAKISQMEMTDAQVIYEYLSGQCIIHFRVLMRALLERTANRRYAFKESGDLTLGKEDTEKVRQIVSNLRTRKPKAEHVITDTKGEFTGQISIVSWDGDISKEPRNEEAQSGESPGSTRDEKVTD